MPLRTSSAPILQSLISSASADLAKDVPHFHELSGPALFPSAAPPHSLSPSPPSQAHHRGFEFLRSSASFSSREIHDSPSSDRSLDGSSSRRSLDGSSSRRSLDGSSSRLSRADSDGNLAFLSLHVLDDDGNGGSDDTWSGFRASSASSKQWSKRSSKPHSLVTKKGFGPKDPTPGKQALAGTENENVVAAAAAAVESRIGSPSSNPRLPSPTNRTLDDILSIKNFSLNDGEVYNSIELSPTGSLLACNGKGCRPLTDSECKELGLLDKTSGFGSENGIGLQINNIIYGNLPATFENTEIAPASSTDSYYEELLKKDPQNPLLLSNYAQFLYEKGDVSRSEEYYGRAILADPKDGEVLSQFAKLQWDVHGDQDRAESYFQQSAQAAPDDCYVMASYASFLWDVEGDNEEADNAHAEPTPMPSYGAPASVSPPLLTSV